MGNIRIQLQLFEANITTTFALSIFNFIRKIEL